MLLSCIIYYVYIYKLELRREGKFTSGYRLKAHFYTRDIQIPRIRSDLQKRACKCRHWRFVEM